MDPIGTHRTWLFVNGLDVVEAEGVLMGMPYDHWYFHQYGLRHQSALYVTERGAREALLAKIDYEIAVLEQKRKHTLARIQYLDRGFEP